MCERISVCAACLRFDSQREALPENRSLDTEKQQVKAVFWHLLVAAGLFVRPAQSQGYCVFVGAWICVYVPSKQAGEISPAWSGLLFLLTSVRDKTEGP